MHKLCRNRTNKQRNSRFLLFHFCSISFCLASGMHDKKLCRAASVCGWNDFLFRRSKSFHIYLDAFVRREKKIAFWRHSSAHTQTHINKLITHATSWTTYQVDLIINDNFNFFFGYRRPLVKTQKNKKREWINVFNKFQWKFWSFSAFS